MLPLKVSLFLCFVLNAIATSSMNKLRNCVVISANKAVNESDIKNLKTLLKSNERVLRDFDEIFIHFVVSASLDDEFSKDNLMNFKPVGLYCVLVDKNNLIEELSKYEEIGNFVIYGYDRNGDYYEHFFSKEKLCSEQ